MQDLNVNVGDGTGSIQVKNVEGDNTEINTHSSKLDIKLFKELLSEEMPTVFDNPETAEQLSHLKSSDPDVFQKALDFFVGVAQGVTIRWLSKILLS
jgi:hypothetical protein